jgi:ketosteroid isomerase-like protein
MQEIFESAGNPDPTARDRALFAAALADDAQWVVTGQYSWSRTFTGKQSILNDLHAHVRSLLAERARTVAHRFIADDDCVVVEARGDNVTRTGVTMIIAWRSGSRTARSRRSGNIATRC